MPMHDWTRFDDGIWHDLHCGWVVALSGALNNGELAAYGHYALIEFNESPLHNDPSFDIPKSAFNGLDPETVYIRRRRTVGVYREADRAKVGIIELLWPGVKRRADALDGLVGKVTAAVRLGLSAVVVDPFPPTDLAPDGVHAVIWERLTGRPAFPPPSGQTLVAASYSRIGGDFAADVEPFAVGEPVPAAPLELPGGPTALPLEAAYLTAFGGISRYTRAAVEGR